MTSTFIYFLIHKKTNHINPIILFCFLLNHVYLNQLEMYVTKPLSMYRKSPSTLSSDPPEGPYSGYLIITDEEAEAEDTFCFGGCKRRRVKSLPFPQDKILAIVDSPDYKDITVTKVLLIPVLDQPLSCNHYYVIQAKGKYKGQVCVCSSQMDMGFCCFKNFIKDQKPKPFDHTNIYQHMKIHRHHRQTFFAKSVAPDGFPPAFLRKKGWEVHSSRLYRSRLNEALGLDISLRRHLPSTNFPISKISSEPVVVGEWYCPFLFVREETRLRHQMKKSLFYKMTLEQSWVQIYCCENLGNGENVVNINKRVKREVNYVFGLEAVRDNKVSHGGFYWYRNRNQSSGRRVSLGLSYAIIEKMKWVLEEVGWVSGGEREARIERIEERRNYENGWRRFGCYVLVESFVLSRLDGSLMLKCEFRHTQRIHCKWE